MSSDEKGSNPEAELIETGTRLESDKDGKVTVRHEAEVRMVQRWATALKERFIKKSKSDQDSN